jgi:hypothetical protein
MTPVLENRRSKPVGFVAGIVAAAVSALALNQQIRLATRVREIESAVAELVTRLTADIPPIP